jgi:hypothetical protein
MARSLNFQYKYPYNIWSSDSRFYMEWDTSRVSLSGNYTYPLSFKKTYPYIVKARITITASNVSGTSVLNRSWYLYLYNGSWRSLVTFTMPSSGEYTWEGTVGYSNCQKFTAVPTSTLSTSTEWNLGLNVEGLWIQESLTTVDLSTADYLSDLFTNQSGVQLNPCQVSVNIGGVITKATKALVNMGGTLTELPTAHSGTYTTTAPESMRVFEFTPSVTGIYRIEISQKSGDHEGRLYSSTFVQVHPNGSSNSEGGYFYSGEFSLTGGSVYFLSLIHYYSNTATADSVVLINKI